MTLPPLDLVQSLIHYNAITGQLTYLQRRGPRRPGDPAGSTQSGIPYVYLAGRQRRAAAVAWMLYHGADPSPQHVHCRDGNPLNLAISNLALSDDPPSYLRHRGVRKREPAWMRKDVRYDRGLERWVAKYRRQSLGEFLTRKEAIAARKLAAEQDHSPVQEDDDA